MAGFGYTGATYVNRIENLESKMTRYINEIDALGDQVTALDKNVVAVGEQIKSLNVDGLYFKAKTFEFLFITCLFFRRLEPE